MAKTIKNLPQIFKTLDTLENVDHDLLDLFIEVRLAWDSYLKKHKNYDELITWLKPCFNFHKSKWGWTEFIRKTQEEMWGPNTRFDDEQHFYADHLSKKLDWQKHYGQKRYQGYSINKKTYINFLEDLYDIKPGAGYSKESFILPAIYQVRRPQTKIDAEIDKSYSVHTFVKRYEGGGYRSQRKVKLEGFKLKVTKTDIFNIWRTMTWQNTKLATESRVQTARKANLRYLPLLEKAKKNGWVGQRAIARFFRREKIASPKGGYNWSPSSVDSLLKVLNDEKEKRPLTTAYEGRKNIDEAIYDTPTIPEILYIWDAIRKGNTKKLEASDFYGFRSK